MRLSPDAKAYAKGVAGGQMHELAIAEAFQFGANHERARTKKLERMATRATSTTSAPEPEPTPDEALPTPDEILPGLDSEPA